MLFTCEGGNNYDRKVVFMTLKEEMPFDYYIKLKIHKK